MAPPTLSPRPVLDGRPGRPGQTLRPPVLATLAALLAGERATRLVGGAATPTPRRHPPTKATVTGPRPGETPLRAATPTVLLPTAPLGGRERPPYAPGPPLGLAASPPLDVVGGHAFRVPVRPPGLVATTGTGLAPAVETAVLAAPTPLAGGRVGVAGHGKVKPRPARAPGVRPKGLGPRLGTLVMVAKVHSPRPIVGVAPPILPPLALLGTRLGLRPHLGL